MAKRIENQVYHRAALAVFLTELLDDAAGRDTATVTHRQVGVLLGINRNAAAKQMKALGAASILIPQGAGKGDPSRYRLRKLTDAREVIADTHADVVDALVDSFPEATAELIKLVEHPAWGYSRALSHQHWLRALGLSAGVPASEFGISKERAKQLDDTLNRCGLLDVLDSPTEINGVLDAIAAAPAHGNLVNGVRASARQAAGDAWATYKAEAEAFSKQRVEASVLERDVHELIRDTVTDLKNEGTPLPLSPLVGKTETRDERAAQHDRWIEAMTEQLGGATFASGDLYFVKRALRNVLTSMRYDAVMIDDALGDILAAHLPR
ncbi:hypothetical protein [Leifsonia xyli]|uniref:hypothetical protein n=1 Tax=Leifsonia xyli TaxID=1575 RepID=UPI003D676A3C